jgi:glycosyltransferase involved in cell wall biosynthesis
MEAMALEVPVAAYRIPGVDKLILHDKTGLMADFGQVEDLKNCWERLLFNETLAREMARNGKEHILKNFSAQRMANEYKELYQEIRSLS